MVMLPKVKLRALVSFPSSVEGGAGIDVSVENGNYTIDLDYSEFVPGTSAPPGSYTVVWDPANNVYTLVPISAVGGVAPSNANPIMDGVAAPGSSALYSRGDHVHPSDTSKADVASLGEAIDDRVAGLLVAGANVTLTYNDPANTLTIASSGGGGVPATAVPLVEAGTGAVGTSTKYAREDHVHPLGPGGGGGASVLVSATPPVGAADNSLWWESDTGNLYIRYNDGTGPSQWVIVTPNFSASALNAVTYVPQTLTSETVPYGTTVTQRAQARQNIYAAPFDAMAYNGMQINGSMDVSQELGTTGRVTPGYVCDGWYFTNSSTAVLASAQNITGINPGLPAFINAAVSTAQATLTTTQACTVFHPVEGYRISRLAWGTASAQPITIGFWTCHHRAGTYSIAVRSNTDDRSYTATYTQNVVDAWEYKVVTIPGCVDGTWEKTNQAGMRIQFAFACGPTYTAPATNTWYSTLYIAAPGQINAVAATSDAFRITGVVVLPGIEAPSAARSPLIMRPYDQELVTCQRYYRQYGGATAYEMMASGQPFSAGGANILLFFGPPMRAPPTITPVGSLALTNAATATIPTTGMSTNFSSPVSASLNVLVASGLVSGNVTLLTTNNDINARLKIDARL